MPLPPRVWRLVFDVEAERWRRRASDSRYRQFRDQTLGVIADAVDAPGPIVDLGCGPGNFAIELANRGFNVVGLDFSAAMLNQFREAASPERPGSAHCLRGDLTRPLPLREGQFKAALCLAAISVHSGPSAGAL